jgi:prolyl-tRNA synthetase
MKYSHLFTRTKKQVPKDEVTTNARLLVKAGFVHKTMAGVYSFLPLGLRVLRKIEEIIRREMNAVGGQEVFLPALHPAENWQQSGGWDSIDVLFKIKSRTNKDYALGQSHEEIIAPIIKEYISSYKDLPLAVYQIQEKYRDELRAKSGVLRGREFGMKDMYSFHMDQKDFDRFYEVVKKAYFKIFSAMNLVVKATEASGGDFTEKISYEFMVLTDAGEDDILYCNICQYCVNTDIAQSKPGEMCPKCKKGRLKKARASEVGNVFDLGKKYTKAFDLYVLNEKGKKIYPLMGCYGIGTSRLLGVIVEKFNDKNGIIWPDSVAPFKAHLIHIGDKKVKDQANKTYKMLLNSGIEVFWDEREDISAGEKFADADLIGIPYRLLVSEKTAGKIEIKPRNTSKTSLLSVDGVIKKLG